MPNNHWTKDRCAEVAKRYLTRSEFARAMSGCYSQAARKGFLDDICSHMAPQESSELRWVYAIVWRQSREAYIGLTWNLNRRMKGHRIGRLRFSMRRPHRVILLTGPHRPERAASLEKEAIRRFRANAWCLLNSANGGALGGTRKKWTKAACIREARKFTVLADFAAHSTVAYSTAHQMGWADEVNGHLLLSMTPHGTWTKERCAEAAASCSTKREFRTRFDVARQIAQRNGWTDEICAHMRVEKRPNGFWTKAACCEAAKSFPTKTSFVKGCGGAYDAAWKNGWLPEVFKNLGRSHHGKFDKETTDVTCPGPGTGDASLAVDAGAD